jgi:hypothetical protein
MIMLVKAKAKGHFGSLREVGDEFEVPHGTKGSWFTPVAASANEKPAGKGKGKPAESEPDGDEAANAI